MSPIYPADGTSVVDIAVEGGVEGVVQGRVTPGAELMLPG
jgi:hypothetical protein